MVAPLHDLNLKWTFVEVLVQMVDKSQLFHALFIAVINGDEIPMRMVEAVIAMLKRDTQLELASGILDSLPDGKHVFNEGKHKLLHTRADCDSDGWLYHKCKDCELLLCLQCYSGDYCFTCNRIARNECPSCGLITESGHVICGECTPNGKIDLESALAVNVMHSYKRENNSFYDSLITYCVSCGKVVPYYRESSICADCTHLYY